MTTRTRSRSAWRGVLAAVTTLSAALALALPASPAAAVAPAGTAAVLDPNGDVLNGGGSATVFGLQLPLAATCPGDTYHHDDLVYSYAIPASVDMASVDFSGTFPSKGVALVTKTGDPYVTVATAVKTAAVPVPPLFSWTRFDHDLADFPMGLYNVGIACAVNEGHIQRYWNARIRFSASTSDPGGFTWKVLSRQPGSDGATAKLASVGGVLGLAAVAAGVGVLQLRRRRDRLGTR